ncbi:MAG TPA: TonB family protein [Verrucomicrobiae bacterium]|nr:TonB family protein [Verrucomicrobiae bacterium]
MLNWTATIWPIAAAAAVKSTVILAAAWLVALAMRKRSAASRHVVWTACAAALLALPLLSLSVPALRLKSAGLVLPGDPGLVFRTTAIARPAPSPGASAPAAKAAPAAAPGAPTDWRTVILLVWGAGAVVSGFQVLLACLALRRMSRAASPHPESSRAALLARSIGIHSPVRVLETPDRMPMTFGLLRPTVILPVSSSEWSESRRRIVLLHELAHVCRGDVATHWMARAALALNWWNPLAWTAWREFLKERERAADDLVLAAGAGQSEYAGHLLEVARTLQSPSPVAAAAIAMARPSQLEGRLLAILADGVNRRQPGRRAAWIAAAAAIALIAPLAAIRAQSTAAPAVPPEVDAAIKAATVQKNHDLLEQAAAKYETLRKYGEAQTLLEASLALREQQSGKQSSEYVEGLVNLGNLARKRGSMSESQKYYEQALALGDRPEAVPALINLGLDAYRAQNPSAAFDYLQRARNVARNGNDMGRAMTWMAFLKSLQPENAAEADALYRGAMSAEDANSAVQALTLEFYGRFLNNQDRSSEAEPIVARAAAIRKSLAGALSRHVLASETTFRVGGGVTAPSLLSKVEPQYSEDARASKIAGTVTLQVVIDTDGIAKEIQVIKSMGYGLDEKAVEAINLWTFKPGTMGGQPVPVQATIEVNFRLM